MVFPKILSHNVVLELKSKEAYLRGGGHLVLRVSLGPGGCWFPLNGRVLGTRGSRGTFYEFFKILLKIFNKTPCFSCICVHHPWFVIVP